jgi:Domain of unknown function (DUF4169)
MSGKIINLTANRKRRMRAAKKARSDENAVKFGQTKAEKTLDAARRDKAARDLDGAKLDEP